MRRRRFWTEGTACSWCSKCLLARAGTLARCLVLGQSQTLLPGIVETVREQEHQVLYLNGDVLVLGGHQVCKLLVQGSSIVRQAVNYHPFIGTLFVDSFHNTLST